MRWPLLPILLLAVFWPAQAEDTNCDGICGRRPLAASHNLLRVVGGTNTLPGTWPWQVSVQLLRAEGYMNICGGSLINAHWVLSAAHCFSLKNFYPFYQLVFGANRLSQPGPDSQARRIKRVVMHEGFQNFLRKRHSFKNDLALVELDEPVTCSNYIQPACLPDESEPVSSLGHCFATGWGTTDNKGKASADVLQEVKLDIISKKLCETYDWGYKRINEENICARKSEGEALQCKADGGGPLMCREERSERFTVVGVTSWGINGCIQAKRPIIFTSTQPYIKWVRTTTQENLFTPSYPPLLAQAWSSESTVTTTTTTTTTRAHPTTHKVITPPPMVTFTYSSKRPLIIRRRTRRPTSPTTLTTAHWPRPIATQTPAYWPSPPSTLRPTYESVPSATSRPFYWPRPPVLLKPVYYWPRPPATVRPAYWVTYGSTTPTNVRPTYWATYGPVAPSTLRPTYWATYGTAAPTTLRPVLYWPGTAATARLTPWAVLKPPYLPRPPATGWPVHGRAGPTPQWTVLNGPFDQTHAALVFHGTAHLKPAPLERQLVVPPEYYPDYNWEQGLASPGSEVQPEEDATEQPQ